MTYLWEVLWGRGYPSPGAGSPSGSPHALFSKPWQVDQVTLSSWTHCSDWSLPMGACLDRFSTIWVWMRLPAYIQDALELNLLEFLLPAVEGATLPSDIDPESSWYSGLLSATGVHSSFRASEHLHCFVRLHQYPYTVLNNILLKFHVYVLPQGYKLLIAQAVNK